MFIDETAVKILWNVRCFYPQGEKNIREVSSKKINLHGVGALAPKGQSHISFPKKTNSYTITIFLLELFIKNTDDEKIKKELNTILNDPNTNTDEVEKEMKLELALKEKDFSQKVHKINELKINCNEKWSKLDRLLNKFRISKPKLLFRLRTNQKENILNSNLKNTLNYISIVWDNAKTHISHHVKEILEFLGVNIIPLPVRCPEFNPIELTWKDCKYEIAKEPIDSEKDLKNFFENIYYESIEKNNYTSYWYEFIEDKRIDYKNYLGINTFI
jgi:transposase